MPIKINEHFGVFLGLFYPRGLKEVPQNGSKTHEKVPKYIENYFSRLVKLRQIDGMMKKYCFLMFLDQRKTASIFWGP